MEWHLKLVGSLLVALAFMHFFFPRYFNWEKDLAPLSLINRQMMYVHTFFIALMVLLMGVLALSSPLELSTTPLGKKLCFGMGVFWTSRLVIQFLWYSPRLWKGKGFETAMHILFSLLWAYISAVFMGVYLH